MSTKTTNYNLTKPALTDNADITVMGTNMDLIDAALAGKASGHAASVLDANINGVAAQTIASYLPVANGIFEIRAYLRVTGQANVAVTVTYNDATGPQTKTMSYQNGGLYFPLSSGYQPYAIGSYPLAPLLINATTAAPITIKVTASVADQALISCAIVEV